MDTDKELVAHGYSNLLSGVIGSVYVLCKFSSRGGELNYIPSRNSFARSPNYLVYVNTLLFYRVGGTTRVAGFLLAVATAVLLVIGTGPIAFIRKSTPSDVPEPC